MKKKKSLVPLMSIDELSDRGFLCGFEFETVIALPGATREALADAFAHEFGGTIGAVNNTYAGHKQQGEADYTRWHFTRDGSICVEQDDYEDMSESRRFLPIEIVSPVVNVCDAHEMVERSYSLLSRVGGTANDSCGLHFTFSSPAVTRETFNPLVFLILSEMQDQKDLRKVSRLGNRYCYPTMTLFAQAWERIQMFCGASPLKREHLTDPALGRGAVRLAGLSKHRHVSINLSKFQTHAVIEYRGLGGDYLTGTTASSVTQSMRAYMTYAALASDPAWIAENLELLVKKMCSVNTGTSYHTRMAYHHKVQDIPDDMNISYLGSDQRLQSFPDTRRDNFTLLFKDYKLRLDVSLQSNRKAYISVIFQHPATHQDILTLHVNSHSPICVDVHRRQLVTESVYRLAVTLARHLSCCSQQEAKTLLLPFFTSKTFPTYKSRFLAAMERIHANRRNLRMEYRRHQAGWIGVARHLKNNLRSNRGRASEDDSATPNVTYEWLMAILRSHHKVAGGGILGHLFGRDSYKSMPDFVRNNSNFVAETLVGALFVGGVANLAPEQIAQISRENSSSELKNAAHLLRSHDTRTVADHLAEKVYSDFNRYFDVQSRCYFEPTLDILCVAIPNYHKVVGIKASGRVETVESLLVQTKAILDLRLDDLLQHMKHTTGSASQWNDYILRFKSSLFSRFYNATTHYDNAWSHPARKGLIVYILGALGVFDLSLNVLKENCSSRELRVYEMMKAQHTTMTEFPVIP